MNALAIALSVAFLVAVGLAVGWDDVVKPLVLWIAGPFCMRCHRRSHFGGRHGHYLPYSVEIDLLAPHNRRRAWVHDAEWSAQDEADYHAILHERGEAPEDIAYNKVWMTDAARRTRAHQDTDTPAARTEMDQHAHQEAQP